MVDDTNSGVSGQEPVLVGRIGAAHGLRGQVRITSFTSDPLSIARFSPLQTGRPGFGVTITKCRLAKNTVIAKLEGIDDRSSAEALNGLDLYVAHEKLPPPDDDEEFLHVDLIGLKVRLETGQSFGEVLNVANYGAGDLLEIRLNTGESAFFPFTRAVVTQINILEGFLHIVPPQEVDGEPQA